MTADDQTPRTWPDEPVEVELSAVVEAEPQARTAMDGPSSKVTASAVSGAAVVVAVYLASLFGVDLPEPVAAGAVLLIATLFGYFVPERRGFEYEGEHEA